MKILSPTSLTTSFLRIALLFSLCLPHLAKADLLPPMHEYANHTSPLGINTNEAMEVDASLPFVDLFRFALPFEEARPWLTKGNIDYDANGWPKRLNGGKAGTRFLSHIPAKALPKGVYTVRYDGQGEIRYGGGAKLVKRLRDRDLIRFEPLPNQTVTATLIIEQSNPKNHLRNIRVLMTGGICANNSMYTVHDPSVCREHPFMSFADHYQQIIFNPDYLNFMKDFKVVRFMNMSGITRNNIRHWNDRPKLTEATWGGKEGNRGVPIEIMVELANQLNINPWFNVPHAASDDYIINLARYVNQRLKPSLKVYLEYTNEAWNNVFVPQAEHMKQSGTRLKLDTDRRIAGFKYYSMQSVHMFKQWEKVFGGTSRLIRVLGGLTTDLAMSETLLAYRSAFKHVDALTIAPYFYIAQDQLARVNSVDSVFDLLNRPDNRYSINNLLEVIAKQAQLAKAYGVDLVAYEGGQHLVDHKTHKLTEGATPHLVAANRDARMAREYYRFLSGWKAAGGNLFIAFSAPRPHTWHGSWGIKEYINQSITEVPKYQALLAFKRGQGCWWRGCETGQLLSHPKPMLVPKHLATGQKPVQQKPASVAIYPQREGIHKAKPNRIGKLIAGTINNAGDLAATWRSSWDQQGLNIWVGIQDDKHVKDSPMAWSDDSVEVYIDADGSRDKTFDGKNDFQLTFRMKDQTIAIGQSSPVRDTRMIRHQMTKTNNGYRLEASIPWPMLGIWPKPGMQIGFDIQINDDDNGDQRDAKISWNAVSDEAWKNPRLFGELVIKN
ncbi:MAG: sugar-binding protein [Leucothrix sp.]